MRKTLITAAVASLGLAAAAQAGIAFSFADPIPGRQLTSTANAQEAGVAGLTYDQSAELVFLVDGTDVGIGNVVFPHAHMEMNLSLGAATTFAGVTQAPVTGSFTIYDLASETRVDILTGVAELGTYVRVGNTNALLFSDPNFVYTPGPALASLLAPGTTFVPSTEAVFTLTDINPSSFLNSNGTFKSFQANASFTGNTEVEVVPAPGAIALAGLGGMLVIRRKRA
ncbi:MAG: hypothetical protein GC200_03065 [Tepidisphaera sp.]|nr:hypothetical protein [Tepidisphaera sp.]